MGQIRTYEGRKYLATAIATCLCERDAENVEKLISRLTDKEVILATHRDEKTGHGHTHIACSIADVDEATREELISYFFYRGHKVYTINMDR